MLFGWLTLLVSVLLNLLVVFYLFRDKIAQKRYYIVFVFCIMQVLMVGMGTVVASIAPRNIYIRFYWATDLTGHLLITLVILTLIRIALTEQPRLRWVPVALFAVILTVGIISMLTFRGPSTTRWMNSVSRNLSVAEEGLNLVLWPLLLRRREFDVQLLILSAGIGMQVTGEVIGLTLRPYTNPSTIWVPNLLTQISELLCLAIWIWAFRSHWSAPSGT